MTSTKPTILISGASSGFGKSLALISLSRGYNVIATSRSLSALKPLSDAGAFTLALDVTSSDATLSSIAATAAAKYGGITHLFTCAGYILEGAWEEATADEISLQFSVNVLGTINTVRAFTPYLRAAGEAWKTGSSGSVPKPGVATFGSLASWIGGSAAGFYCGTKWAVSGLTEGLRDQFAPFGIDVMVVEPGMFRTEFLNTPESDNAGSSGQGNRRISTQKSMDIYSGPGGTVYTQRKTLDEANNKQLGNTDLGCALILDVMMRTGSMEGRTEVPVRLPLGADAIAVIRGKCEATLQLLKEWEEVVSATASKEGVEFA